MKKIIVALLLSLSTSVMAFEADDIYFGVGFSKDKFDGASLDNSLLVFAGIPLEQEIGEFELAAELAYIQYGDFDVCAGAFCASADAGDAFDISGLGAMELNDQFDLLARVGYLMTDGDDEIQFGAGAQYFINDNFSARGEYLIAGDIDSMVFTLKYTR